MDHSHHIRLQEQELTPDTLTGATIYGPGDEKIGHVAHVHGSGADAQVVIDVGGFLGIGSKAVAVSVRELEFMRGSADTVHAVTRWTKEDLKALPEHHD